MRSLGALAFTFLVAAGCGSVSQPSAAPSGASAAPSTAVPGSPAASLVVPSNPGSAAPTVPSVPATIGPSIAPTDSPIATPSSTKTPKPTASAAPNLVIGKFEIDANVVVAEKPVDAVITIRNRGTVDASRFDVKVLETNTDDGVKGESDPFTVEEGLAAGASTEVTISLTLAREGSWKLAATADAKDEVDESNEGDNAKELTVDVVAGLPDFSWVQGGFMASDSGESNDQGRKINLVAEFKNSGTATYSATALTIGITWYRDEDSASGDLDPFAYGDDMPPGVGAQLSKIDYLPGPGTYTLYAFIDDGRVVDELDEDNNEESVKLTIN